MLRLVKVSDRQYPNDLLTPWMSPEPQKKEWWCQQGRLQQLHENRSHNDGSKAAKRLFIFILRKKHSGGKRSLGLKDYASLLAALMFLFACSNGSEFEGFRFAFICFEHCFTDCDLWLDPSRRGLDHKRFQQFIQLTLRDGTNAERGNKCWFYMII